MTIKYVLCPGQIGKNFINAKQLSKLYKVQMNECVKQPRDADLKGWEPPPNTVFLHPQPSGIYQLPTNGETNP